MWQSTGNLGRHVVLIALSAGALVACGGGGSEAPPLNGRGESSLAASQPGELLAYVKDKLRARQVQRLALPGVAFTGGGAPPLTVAASPAGDSLLRSGTTVQEAGVDEDDLIKSDGEFIYTLDTTPRGANGQTSPRLQAHRRLADGRIEATATLNLPVDAQAVPVLRGMLLSAGASAGAGLRRIAVIGESVTLLAGPDPCLALVNCTGGPTILPAPGIVTSEVQLQRVDASAGGGLAAGDRISISGRLIGSRLIGNTLYLVSTHAPQLAIEALPATATEAEREALLAQLVVSDVLPTIRINGGAAQALLADTDCLAQAKNASLGIELTSITEVDLASPTFSPRSRCVVGGTEAVYMSARSLVLATTRYAYNEGTSPGTSVWRYPVDISTDLHRFALNAAGLVYSGSGSVVGHLGWDIQRKPYRISEHNGDLRVLSFTGDLGWGLVAETGTPPSPATLTVLRERPADQTLQEVSRLPNAQRPALLGKPGEQVYAVRFAGDRAYLVTFRQIDPLYLLDLSNPADPKVVGELSAPGFSDYLYPLDGGLLFGVGRQASATGVTGGVKVALFDVRDPTQARELAVQVFGERGSASALDFSPHGLNVLTVGSVTRFALPLFVSATAPAASQQGLQRIEVDTVARTMRLKPMIPAAASSQPWDLWGERSLQIGAQLYWLSQGRLGASDW